MPSTDLTPIRAQRLCRMLVALGHGPLDKRTLVKRLRIEERGFFRDLRFIRDLGINVASSESGYVLTISLDDAFTRLPVPDLRISLRDALELSSGQAPVHKRVRRKLEAIIGPVADLDPPVRHRSVLEA